MKTSFASGLRVLTWAVLLAAGGFTSCSDDDDKGGEPTPPPVQLVDQIEYDGGTAVDIKSAIYEVEDTDLYTFYLSPTEGITSIKGMTDARDYLQVKVRNPKGAVDIASEEYEISYKDITINDNTKNDIESVTLQADLVAMTSRLNFYLEVVMKSGKTLLARYNNTCMEAQLPTLNNQYELNEEATAIGSVLLWNDPSTGARNYYFYANSGVTAPQEDLAGLTITLAKDVDTSINLGTADPEQVKVVCGDFSTAAGTTTGTLTLESDAKNGTITLTLDAEQGDTHLRAAYTGTFVEGFVSRNYLKVTEGENTEETALTQIFINKGLSNVLTFGQVEAQTPEDLMSGHYAVSLTMSTAQLQGGTADIAAVRSQLFDYEAYKTYDNANFATGMKGSFTTAQTADGKKTYIRFTVQYPDGPSYEGEWSGELTTLNESFDITPVAPFRSHITIMKSDGVTTVTDVTLGTLEMRMEKNYKLRGGDPQNGGATFDAYVFYFRPEGNEDGVESKNVIPQFMIPASYVGQSNINLASGAEDLHWSLNYQSSGLQTTEYSESYSMYGMTFGYCPSDAKATVVRNEDGTWKVSFSMTDTYLSYGYPTGSGNKLVIEWEGPATKYTGSKTNDLTDGDY